MSAQDIGDMATINVKKQLALEEIVKAENIEASDEEVEKKYNEMGEQFGMKVEDVKSRISKDDLAYDVKSIKAFELVKENAKITEKSVTAEELEKLNAPETTEESEEKSEETEEKPKKKTTRKPRAKRLLNRQKSRQKNNHKISGERKPPQRRLLCSPRKDKKLVYIGV